MDYDARGMKVIALGSRAFISGFMLSGVSGVEARDSTEALEQINNVLLGDKELGLLIVSDDISKGMLDELTEIRANNPVPLIYVVPAPGSKSEKVEYRELIKRVLKMA